MRQGLITQLVDFGDVLLKNAGGASKVTEKPKLRILRRQLLHQRIEFGKLNIQMNFIMIVFDEQCDSFFLRVGVDQRVNLFDSHVKVGEPVSLRCFLTAINPKQRTDSFIVDEILRLDTRRQSRRRQALWRFQVIFRSRVQTQHFLPALRIYVWSGGRINHWLRRIRSNCTISDILDVFIAVGDYRRFHFNLWIISTEPSYADGSIFRRLQQETLINLPRTRDFFLWHFNHLFTFIFPELYRLKTAVLGKNLID